MDKIKPHLQKAGRLLFEHFEKIILAVVLVILAYDSFNMVFGISGVQRDLETARNTLKNTAPGGRVLTNDPSSDFKRYIENDGTESFDEMNALLAKGHRVFNPDVWKRLSNRVVRIRSGDEFGLGAMAVTNLTPYFLKIKPEHKRTGQGTSQYRLTVQDNFVYQHVQGNLFYPTYTPPLQANYGLISRIAITGKQPQRVYETVHRQYVRNNLRHPNYVGLRILDLNPSSMAIELRTNHGTNTFNIPYNRESHILRGYSVGMYYAPTRTPFPARRLGSRLHIDGQSFLIRALEPSPKNILSSSLRPNMHPKSVIFTLLKTGKEVEVPIRARPAAPPR